MDTQHIQDMSNTPQMSHKDSFSIYKLHDDVKDKDFELELTWVCAESNRSCGILIECVILIRKHVLVPEDLRKEAIRKAVKLQSLSISPLPSSLFSSPLLLPSSPPSSFPLLLLFFSLLLLPSLFVSL